MIINKIVKLGLEHRIKELKETNSERKIASILSNESNQKITQSNVHRYLDAQVREHKDLIEKKESLQAKLVENEIDTIGKRNKIVARLERIADKAEKEGVDRTVLEALKVQISALDSLDKRLGRFAPQQIAMKVDGEITHKIDIKTEVRRYITALELLPQEDIIEVEAVQK